MNVNLFFNWLGIGELLTFKTGPPCRIIFQTVTVLNNMLVALNVFVSKFFSLE